MLMRYTSDDYDKINSENLNDSFLSEQINRDFEDLYKLVDEYIASLPPITQNEYTHYDKKKHRKYYKNNRKYDNQEQWNQQPLFKATQIEKKEGIDEKYNELRSTLNKITLKNKDTVLPKIIELVQYVMNEENEESDSEDSSIQEDCYSRIMNILLDIVKKTNGGHEVYVIVLKEWIQCYPSFVSKITDFIDLYKNSYDNIIDIDANQQYDAYCELVKHNDYRRSNSKFIIQLTSSNMISQDETLSIIDTLFDRVLENIDRDEKTVLIEEITENLSIFMIQAYKCLNAHEQWDKLIEKLNKCSKLKAREHKSISSRIVFKYMDIQDAFKKMSTKE